MRLSAFLLVTTLAAADLKPPRNEPSHFATHATLGGLTIAAEYLVRGLPGDKEVFFVRDFLVVEVALFPKAGAVYALPGSAFALRLNNGKTPLLPAPAQMVAASLKYEDWTVRPSLQTGISSDGGTIVIGGPQRTGRFPDDPTVVRDPRRTPPRVETRSSLVSNEEASETAHEAAVAYALPETRFHAPVRGYLYFPYTGKTKSLKKVALLFQGDGAAATLVLK